MKHDIIKTDNYLLVVDESEITKGNWHLANDIMITKSHLIDENCKKIIAHLPLNGSPILEGVDLLPPLEDKIDVEKIAELKFGTDIGGIIGSKEYDLNSDLKRGFVSGYNQAKEKYKYTEEDMRKAIDYCKYNRAFEYDFETIIQSLSQPKMPIGFECVMEKDFRYNDDGEPFGFKVHNSDKITTTTTPEGHIQWVGTYIFN